MASDVDVRRHLKTSKHQTALMLRSIQADVSRIRQQVSDLQGHLSQVAGSQGDTRETLGDLLDKFNQFVWNQLPVGEVVQPRRSARGVTFSEQEQVNTFVNDKGELRPEEVKKEEEKREEL